MREPLYYSDNPLKWFDKAPKCWQIELMEQYKYLKMRVNNIMVTPFDKEVFSKQIKDLLELNLIQKSYSLRSYDILVRKHVEIKRGKN